MRKLLVLAGVVALLLTACRGESVTRLRIDPSGTVTVISEFAFDEEALALIGDLEDTPEDVLRALSEFLDASALPVPVEGIEPEQFERGDLKGIRVTLPGLDPIEVVAQLSSGSSIIDDVTLSLADGVLRMSGRTREVSDFERARLLSLAPGPLAEILAVTLQVEVPGTVTDHNADRVLDGGVLEWDLLRAITEGDDVFVLVESTVEAGFQFVDLEGTPIAAPEAVDPVSSGTPWWLVVVPFALAGAISWFIIIKLRNRKRLPTIEGFTPKG